MSEAVRDGPIAKIGFRGRSLRKSETLDQVIRGRASHTTGFDYLRVGLALAVLFVHVVYVTSVSNWQLLWTHWCGPFERSLLPMFFSLSGFLVAGSLLRNNVPKFIALRMIRIIPALAVEIFLSAFVIGLAFTKLSWLNYLSSGEFYTYFLNILGIVHYTLPGVFEGRYLNEQLWTMPFEFECYLSLAALTLIGIVRRRDIFVLVLASVAVAYTIVAVSNDLGREGPCVPGHVFILSFLFGVAIYFYKAQIPHSRLIFAMSLVVGYVCLYIPDLVYVSAIPISYLTIYIGLLRPPRIKFGDLSYGIYLFHYPIARCAHELSGRSLPAEVLLPLTIAATTMFAALSWKFVEKPALDRKADVLAFVDRVSKWSVRRMPRRAASGSS